MPREPIRAFAPGRVNLIGEHTDYNEGLALPFAIVQGVVVTVQPRPSDSGDPARMLAWARDLDERDEVDVNHPTPASGWRAFVRGAVAELIAAGVPLAPAQIEIAGDVPRGAGLSSSAALEVALCLGLIELASRQACAPVPPMSAVQIALLCTRVENRWVGANTGPLDQLASLCGSPDMALCIDFRTLTIDPVPLTLGAWRLVVLDSGQRHDVADSGYNQRRAECDAACARLGVKSLREAREDDLQRLPEPLRRRLRHVLGENRRVVEAAQALRSDDLSTLGSLLNASHASLRDDYEVSTPAVEAAVRNLREAGAAGARMVGGGFGGSVLGLFGPGAHPPAGAVAVSPGPGAHLLTDDF